MIVNRLEAPPRQVGRLSTFFNMYMYTQSATDHLLQLNDVSSEDEDLPDASCVMGKSTLKSDRCMAVKTEGISSSSPIIVENAPTSSNWNETTEYRLT